MLKHRSEPSSLVFKPIHYRLNNKEDVGALMMLLEEKPFIRVNDTIQSQIQDLVIAENPTLKNQKQKLKEVASARFNTTDLSAVGVWIYYPWSNNICHILDEDDFIYVRTIRNRHKITADEQHELCQKKIGIVGLSVGQSIAISLIQERICGHIFIADFDNLELSNLNRIRSSISNIGIPKSVLVAREISEIDPFIKIEVFMEGINSGNINDFLNTAGKLDLVVDECDSLETKIDLRKAAKDLCIPVVMDTSDNLFIDIERFDIEARPIFHNLIDYDSYSQSQNSETYQKLILQLLEFDKLSERGKMSLSEIGKSISTWPQLASDVNCGAGFTAKIVREILLGHQIPSGRFRIDLVEQLREKIQFQDILTKSETR